LCAFKHYLQAEQAGNIKSQNSVSIVTDQI
jgi:hypothetical protein